MEVQEEVMGSNDQMHISKGKRTKRLRLSPPLALTMICSSSSGEEGEGGGRVSDYSGGVDPATTTTTTTSPTTSTDQEFVESTEEEEDMANCLILLAQGRSRKAAEPAAAATISKAAGFYVYQCKTCDRCFPSFQALGGHRASHKRPKAVAEEKRTWASMEEEDDQFNHNSTTLSLQIPNRGLLSSRKSKVHECSICGAEFSSGQALGGHMRRHRTFTGNIPPPAMPMAAGSPDQSQAAKKPRNILHLDLNLPAPEDDHRDSKFPFIAKEQTLVFSASHLVDCHY